MDIVYHYTTGQKIVEIIRDGAIKVSGSMPMPGEKPVCSFSTRDVWEPTANKYGVTQGTWGGLTQVETEQQYDGLDRIVVSAEHAPLTWRKWQQTSGVQSWFAKGMDLAALKMGSNVAYYRMSYESVTADKWLAIERYMDGAWLLLPPARN